MNGDMVRFVMVGTGRITDWVLKGALQDPRFKAVGVCSRSEESAYRFIAGHPEAFGTDARIFTSIEDAVACPMVDAVYIGTPNSTHLPYTLAALKAGKHVLCEKPMGMSEDEVAQMLAAAKENGCLLMEAMISTLIPAFRAAREKMSEIGTIRHFSSSFCQYSSKYADLKKGIVANSFNPKMGGGALPDIGVYTTFPMVALFGYPEKVHSSMIHVPTPEGDVNVQGSALLEYPGMTANIVFSKCCDAFAPTELCGELGNILIDQIHIARKATFLPHHAPTSGRGKGAEPELITEGIDHDEYYYEFKEFMDVIESGRRESDINTLEVSLLNARLMDEIKAAKE